MPIRPAALTLPKSWYQLECASTASIQAVLDIRAGSDIVIGKIRQTGAVFLQLPASIHPLFQQTQQSQKQTAHMEGHRGEIELPCPQSYKGYCLRSDGEGPQETSPTLRKGLGAKK